MLKKIRKPTARLLANKGTGAKGGGGRQGREGKVKLQKGLVQTKQNQNN